MSGDFCHREGTGAIHLNGAAASRAIAQRKNGAGSGLRSPMACTAVSHRLDPVTWQNGGRVRRAEPGALPRLPGTLQCMPRAGFLATFSNFQNLQITSWCSSLLRPRHRRTVEVLKKGMKQEL